MSEFSKRLQIAMSSKKITQAELSKKTNISKGALSSYVNGRYEPTAENLEKIAEILEVYEEWLMGGDIPMSNKKVILYQNPNILSEWIGHISRINKLPINEATSVATWIVNVLADEEAEFSYYDLETSVIFQYKPVLKSISVQALNDFLNRMDQVTSNQQKMIQLMNQLNEIGQDKAIDQVEMLTKIEEFKK